ncbi:ABC transporter ATP-binding protein [Rhizobium leguminosarum]|uniref:ABC transporter ATP-binding protein n=1 Tax=Rhizobium leguminosarum TaxID=384 RepID=UPI003ECC76BF
MRLSHHPIFVWLENRVQIDRGFDKVRTPPTHPLRYLWFHLIEIRPWIVLIFATSLVYAAFEAFLFLAVGWGIDALSRVHANGGNINAIFYLLIISISFIRPFLFFVSHVSVDQIVVPNLSARVRWRNHLHAMKQPVHYFLNQPSGKIANRIVQSGDAVKGATIEVFDNISYVVVFCVITALFLVSLHVYFTIVFGVWFLFFLGLIHYFVKRAQYAAQNNASARSVFSGRIVDIYNNFVTVKLFARTEEESNILKADIYDWAEKHRGIARLITTTGTMLEIANSILISTFALICIYLWRQNSITGGEIAATLGLVLRIVGMSGWIMYLFKGVFDAFGTVRDSMDTVQRGNLPETRRHFEFRGGKIQFDKVSFAYHRDRLLFENFSLAIEAGEKVGIVGESGAGKSTILDLVLGLQTGSAGSVVIDGQSVADVNDVSLWRAITLVSSQVGLLNRSVKENICIARPDATASEIDAAVRLAHADKFIPALIDSNGRAGYEAHVGPSGSHISAGQRQRIMLARAFLKDSPILLLDEATSALDPRLEAAVTESLLTWFKYKTAIVVSHRLSTLTSFNRILVLHKGGVIEEGDHQSLLSMNGRYAELWRIQTPDK